MTPEERASFQRLVVLAEENHNMLRGIQRSMRFARLMTAVYWLFIIGSTVGAYYLIQPYIDGIKETYSGAESSFSGLSGVLDSFKQD